jgi:cyclopropane fatty-acyl-phospholipid synthase-like methyltransferase
MVNMASSTDRRFNPENLLRLTETDRQARWQPEQRLKFARLKPGTRVLEMGCGPGFKMVLSWIGLKR